MKTVYLIITLTINFSLIAQIKTDTIDYSSIKGRDPHGTYILEKITSGPKFEKMNIGLNNNEGGLAFILDPDPITLEANKQTFSCFHKYKYNSADTVVCLTFDIETFDKKFPEKQWGIFHVQKRNIITIDKVRANAYMRREFKVIKWTRTEIILKDNSHKELNRIYYLKSR